MRSWKLQIEPYPFPTPPVEGETTVSYLARLATINRVERRAVLNHIAEHKAPTTLKDVDPDWDNYDLALNNAAKRRLATAASAPLATLDRTLWQKDLIAYSPHAPHVPFVQFHRVAKYHSEERLPLAGCPRCAHVRGFPLRPQIYMSGDRVACVRHRLWLADQPNGRPVDLRPYPELLDSVRRFRRLCGRGRREAHEAFDLARGIWFRYRVGLKSKEKHFLQERWREFTVSMPGADVDGSLAPRYPEIVVLACMIRSPYWLAAARQPYFRKSMYRPWEKRVRPDLGDFVAELARRIGHPRPERFSVRQGSVASWARGMQRLSRPHPLLGLRGGPSHSL